MDRRPGGTSRSAPGPSGSRRAPPGRPQPSQGPLSGVLSGPGPHRVLWGEVDAGGLEDGDLAPTVGFPRLFVAVLHHAHEGVERVPGSGFEVAVDVAAGVGAGGSPADGVLHDGASVGVAGQTGEGGFGARSLGAFLHAAPSSARPSVRAWWCINDPSTATRWGVGSARVRYRSSSVVPPQMPRAVMDRPMSRASAHGSAARVMVRSVKASRRQSPRTGQRKQNWALTYRSVAVRSRNTMPAMIVEPGVRRLPASGSNIALGAPLQAAWSLHARSQSARAVGVPTASWGPFQGSQALLTRSLPSRGVRRVRPAILRSPPE